MGKAQLVAHEGLLACLVRLITSCSFEFLSGLELARFCLGNKGEVDLGNPCSELIL